MSDRHVVIGAGGGLGAAITRRLVAEGRQVRAVVRDPGRVRRELPTVELVQADARDAAALREVCRGASVVYHCVNVPYEQWAEVMLPVTEAILHGTATAGARLVFPGNVYGYGRLKQIPAPEGHVLGATSRKGRLRIALEERMMEAHRQGRCPVVIARMPDYYGPGVVNPLFGPLFEAPYRGKRGNWIGRLDVPHDLVFIDDAAAACVQLGQRLDTFGQAWHVPGAGALTGHEFVSLCFAAAGKAPRVGTLGRWSMALAGLFVAGAREMGELMYEFEEPLVLDGAKFGRAFPAFRYTPHPDAARLTSDWFRRRLGVG